MDGVSEELEFGGETVQRRFTEAMETVEVVDHQVAQAMEVGERSQQRESVGPIWTAPDLPQIQTAGDHSGAASRAPPAPPGPMAPTTLRRPPPPPPLLVRRSACPPSAVIRGCNSRSWPPALKTRPLSSCRTQDYGPC